MSKRIAGFGALLALAVGAGAQAQQTPATVRVATLPLANFAPLMVARDQGFFTAEGLNVTWSTVAQGAVAVEAVFGGSAEVGASAMFEPMVARANNLELSFIAGGTRIRATPPDNSGIAVRTADSIQSAKDLVGKKVSAGLLNSVNHVHMQEWLLKAGVDAKSVQFLEIPFPQMADALFQSRLDAVWAVEPFLTFMVQSKNARVIAYPYQENIPGMDITAYFAKDTWAKANPAVAKRFKAAIDKATALLRDAKKEDRDGWVVKWTNMKPEVVAAMNLAEYTTELNAKSLQANLDLAVKHKLAKQSFDINQMIWKH